MCRSSHKVLTKMVARSALGKTSCSSSILFPVYLKRGISENICFQIYLSWINFDFWAKCFLLGNGKFTKWPLPREWTGELQTIHRAQNSGTVNGKTLFWIESFEIFSCLELTHYPLARRWIFNNIIPRARMGSESIAHDAEDRIGYWLRCHEGERNNLYCFSKIQLVMVKKFETKQL